MVAFGAVSVARKDDDAEDFRVGHFAVRRASVVWENVGALQLQVRGGRNAEDPSPPISRLLWAILHGQRVAWGVADMPRMRGVKTH